MNILICNDDGYQAPGIEALYEAVKDLGTVQVIAPHKNNSAKSSALTLHDPIYSHTAANGFTYLTGTPSDCMHIALTGLVDTLPDLILSGINNGANLGDDTVYSGTVGAAVEGYLFGIPALAFSQVLQGWAHLDAAARWARQLVVQQVTAIENAKLAGRPVTATLLNINIPSLPYDEIKPPLLCRLGRRHHAEAMTRQTNPRGQTMHWVGAAGRAKDAAEGTDFWAVRNGHIAITPLQMDYSDHAALRDPANAGLGWLKV